MCAHAHGLRGGTDGRATVGRQARAEGGERRPAAGRNSGLGRRRADRNRDVTPGAWLRGWTDGRTGTGNPAAERRYGLCKKWKQRRFHLVTIVLWKETAFPLWRAMGRR